MATEIVGQCFMCKKDIYRHDLAPNETTGEPKKAVYFKGWPGSGLLCLEHPGVQEEYDKALKDAEKNPSKRIIR
jgi:hypothetical protein